MKSRFKHHSDSVDVWLRLFSAMTVPLICRTKQHLLLLGLSFCVVWTLTTLAVGVMFARSAYEHDPGSTQCFGGDNVMVRVSPYRPIPEE